jgi:mannose-6-phosphate isomerase-like protein (cupin superfamily)
MKLNKISKDSRRIIHAVDGLLPDNKEFTFINLHKGKAIGGCLHDKDEYYVIISGSVKVLIGSHEIGAIAGDSGVFPAGIAHGFIASEDSIISEWGISAADKQNNDKDPLMRGFINNINDTSI